jgi:hypothetical protein
MSIILFDMTGALCHATAVKRAAQYRSIVAKNFKQYLVICSIAVKNIFAVKEVISNDNLTSDKIYNIMCNVIYLIYYILYSIILYII